MDTIQQFFELINKHKNIFIAISDNPSGDAFFSALALKGLLKNIRPDAKIEIACKNLEKFADSKFKGEILKEINLSGKWEFELDISKSKVQSIKYEKTDKSLRVIFTPEDFKSQPGKYAFSNFAEDNLIISLQIKSKDFIVKLFNNQNIDNVYKICIDNIENSEKLYSLNSLNITKEQTSIAHIVYQLFNNDINNKKFDQEILSMLLSAFISATNQFKDSALTNSKLLKAASLLIEKGVNLDKAFSNLDSSIQIVEPKKSPEQQNNNPKEISEVHSWV